MIGCSRSVEYDISGSAKSAEISYALGDGNSVVGGPYNLPCSVTYDKVSSDIVWMYISAQNSTNNGCVSVCIKINGNMSNSVQACGGYSIATCSGSY